MSRVPRGRIESQSDDRTAIGEAARLAARTLDGNAHGVFVLDERDEHTVLLAGTGKFDALWARDACFAGLGAIATGRAGPVRGTLEVLLGHQLPDGRVPRRIGKGSVEGWALLHGLGFTRPRPKRFDTVDGEGRSLLGFSNPVSPDACLLVLWLAAEYDAQERDDAFLDWAYGRLARALEWLRSRTEGGLLVEPPFSDWKDTVNRGRIVAYNQVLFFRALRSFADLAERRNDREAAARARAQAEGVRGRLRERFWDDGGGYFRDSEVRPEFSPDANLLAIWTGLAAPPETARIFARCDALLARSPLLPAADPPYPTSAVPWLMRLAGLRHYHDACLWPWQDAVHAIAAARVGDLARAERVLAAVARIALWDGGFFEVYEGTPPRPVRRAHYRSEPGFSWSAGLFLRACVEANVVIEGAPGARASERR